MVQKSFRRVDYKRRRPHAEPRHRLNRLSLPDRQGRRGVVLTPQPPQRRSRDDKIKSFILTRIIFFMITDGT